MKTREPRPAFNIANHLTWSGPFVARTDGSIAFVEPANGKDFSPEEIQAFLGENTYVEFVRPRGCPGWIMLCDEEGHLKKLPVNAAATVPYNQPDAMQDFTEAKHLVVGDVLFCPAHMVK